MKRILCLLLCLLLPISALALSAASVVADVLQNAADENPSTGWSGCTCTVKKRT